MAIREGAWDCPHCGRKRNRGPDKFCGGCGAPRGEEVRFYLPDDAREVTDAAELERAQAGPDWICPYCEGDNPAGNAFCSGCGAPRDGAAVRPVVEHRDAPMPPPPAPPPPQPVVSQGKGGGLKKGCGIGCLGLLLVVGFFWFLGRPREATLTVEGLSWERSVQVEALRTVTEEAWEDSLPAGARVLSRSRQVHHTNRVQTGTERKTRTVNEQVQVGTERVKVGSRDLGNGYFEDVYEDRPVYENRSHEESYDEPVYREDPVYAVKVRYEIDKWLPAREEKEAGQDRAPSWPGARLVDTERQGARKETYEVRFRDEKGKPCVYKTTDEAEWRRFEPGGSYRAEVRPGGEVVRFLGPPGG
ncbi:MAG TPA: zinc ribbon domain-containing protein [Thermoanaerobaculia bacterium]|nr:zinc ribbon domain-containing protein [Thermoanaerobaculia bacterium]